MIELLAPAGDLERLKVAFLYGADAVYLGGSLFGLRANAVNFSIEEIEEGVKFAHNLGKKVYVTVNIILHDKEINLLDDYLNKLSKINVDAIIISDPAIIPIAKKYPNLDIHLSTQQSTLNYEAIKFWESVGVSRVVLARETTKEDIIKNINNTNVEIEMFIHGAMCASYSGRCVLSNHFTNRDANRGGCSQVCRFDFDLMSKNKFIKGDKNFTFCTKDLMLLKHIKEIKDIGVASLKIEGRMRSIYYIATVISIYRYLIDNVNNLDKVAYNENYTTVLERCANRDCYSQFFDGNYKEDCNYYNERQEISNQDFLGLVLDYDDINKIVTIEQRNYFKVNDEVEFLTPNNIGIPFKINSMEDIDGNILDVARHPKQIIKIPCEIKLNKYDMMRVKILS